MNSTPQLRTDPVREARAGPGEEDEDRAVDRRRLAAEDGRRAPDHRGPAALPRGREAPQHLRRRAPAADRRRRPHPRHVQADRHHDRPDLERGAEPAERAGAHAPTAARCGARSSPTTAGGILTADYSQIELRVLAHLAEDPGLIDAFDRGADVHTATAAKVFGVDESRGRRRAAPVRQGRELRPRLRHGGLRARAAPRHPHGEAAEILDAYFEGFPNVKSFMVETVQEAKERGYTTTIFGRRRQISELTSDNFRIRQMGERMAQNAPVQGSRRRHLQAGDDRPRPCARRGRARRRGCCSPCTTSWCWRSRSRSTTDTETIVRDVMESVTELRVPLTVDIGFGPNWAAAK